MYFSSSYEISDAPDHPTEVPDVDDVGDDLKNYTVTKVRAEELNKRIEWTEKLIEEIVYELYRLTDKEVEIIERG